MAAKPRLSIGTIGHVDHGKTTLTAALTVAFPSAGGIVGNKYEEIDNAPEVSFRGIPMNAAVVKYETADRHYALIDCLRHADVIKNMIAGETPLDGVILVVSATDGPSPQTSEQILVANQVGVPDIIVLLNKTDLVNDEEMLKLVEFEVRELISSYEFPGDDTPIIAGSALNALEALTEDPSINKGDNKWVDKIHELMYAVHAYIPIPRRQAELPFLLESDNVHCMSRAGICAPGIYAPGRIERGAIRKGDEVEIVGTMSTTVTGIDMCDISINDAKAGENVALFLRDVKSEEVQYKMVLAKPGSISLFTKFEAIVYVLEEVEGGTHTPITTEGYSCEFKIRSRYEDVTGKMMSIMNIKDEEGDQLKMIIVKLQDAIACWVGLRFVITKGGKTVGAGLIKSIIQYYRYPSLCICSLLSVLEAILYFIDLVFP